MLSRRGEYHLNHNTKKQNSIYRGLVFAMLSGVSFSIASLLVKQMKNLHPVQLSLYAFSATFVMGLPDVAKNGQNPLGPRKFRLLLVLRGIFGGLSILLSYISFQCIGLGEASVIILSTPVFVTIFARIFFKEPCNIFQSIAVILTVLGIIFTTKLPSRFTDQPNIYSSEQIYGFLAAIFALFCLTFIHLIIRKTRSVHQSIINFNYSWVGLVEIAVLTAVFGKFQWHQCGLQSLYILLLGLFSYSALVLVVMAFQCEYAGPVSTVRTAADITMAFVWQIFIFQDVPDSFEIIGATLVSFSIILIGLGKWVATLDCKFFSREKFQ